MATPRAILCGWLTMALLFGTPALAEEFVTAFERGAGLLQGGDYDGALQAFLLARGQQPKNVDLLQFLVETYRKLHRYPEAEAEAQNLIGISPRDPYYVSMLADLYAEQGKFHNALALYQQLLTRTPGSLELMLKLAQCMEGIDDIDSAAEQYREVMRRAPGTDAAYTAAGRLKRINKAVAARDTNKFFPIDPKLGEAGFGYWNLKKMPLRVYVDSDSGSRAHHDDLRGIVQRALEAWSEASRGAITFELLPTDSLNEEKWKALDRNAAVLNRYITSKSDAPRDPVACDIHVHWAVNLPGALGACWTDGLRSGARQPLRKAHVWVATGVMENGERLPAEESAATTALFEAHERMLEETTTHELGHALGLPHSSHPNDIMCAGIYAFNARDMVEKRRLSTRDAQSLREHYNDFEGPGLPPQLIAQMKQETAPGGAAGKTPAVPGEAGGAEGGSTESTDTPFPGDEKTEESEKKDELEEPGEEGGEKEEEGGPEKGGHAAPARHDPLRSAVLEMNAKRYDQALAHLNKILNQNPSHPQAHYLKAIVLVMMRQYPQAAAEYRQVLKLTPNSPLGKRASEGLKKINF